jgi:hypothetical protein
MSVSYEWQAVLLAGDPVDDESWKEVNVLCAEGWEVRKISRQDGSREPCTVVYLRNPKGFYTHTKTCPKCNKPCPYC